MGANSDTFSVRSHSNCDASLWERGLSVKDSKLGNRLAKLVLESYPRTAKTLVAPLIELLTLSRDMFGGDIDRALVFYAIAARTLEHHKFQTLSTEELDSGVLCDPPSLHTNARSIAESLGIPRESVRRKVQHLIASGLVVRHSNGLVATSKGIAELAPVRRFLVGLAVRYFNTVRSVILEAERFEAVPQNAAAIGPDGDSAPGEGAAQDAGALRAKRPRRVLDQPRLFDSPAST